jgi:hypothetical protein
MDGFGLNLRWVTEPPIILHTGVQFALRAKKMLEDLAGWDEVQIPEEDGYRPDKLDFITNIDSRDWKIVKRTHQERWNLRIKATVDLVEDMCNVGEGDNDHLYIEYRVSGGPVGLMVMSNANTLGHCSISLLVTHPGSDNAGGVLIEFAVKQAVDWGFNGKITLYPNDDECMRAYEALGFDYQGSMFLDPSKSGKWTKVGKTWKLTSQLGKLYRA